MTTNRDGCIFDVSKKWIPFDRGTRINRYLCSRIQKFLTMARPIKETPILYGKDAKRFEERMKNPPRETLEERERRLANYKLFMDMLRRGEEYDREREWKHKQALSEKV